MVKYFVSVTSDHRTNQGVFFGLSEKGSGVDMGVFLLDRSVLPPHPTIGGQNLERVSEKIALILRRLGWQPERIDTLKEMLQKTNCENIASIDGESVSIDFSFDVRNLPEFPGPESLNDSLSRRDWRWKPGTTSAVL